MDKTASLLDMGFSEDEIFSAIDNLGKQISPPCIGNQLFYLLQIHYTCITSDQSDIIREVKPASIEISLALRTKLLLVNSFNHCFDHGCQIELSTVSRNIQILTVIKIQCRDSFLFRGRQYRYIKLIKWDKELQQCQTSHQKMCYWLLLSSTAVV